ncbi:hypothetical protein MPPM_3590 [Methylorubrum populi]|uniref:Uncharacterized protein n=1 Tax=Methylorubrum populi TaxID=223967 RepID=A0A160PHH6_9HYPH|nr:hypothetical protein MPPM_3590 [Methylorubrum populi]
MAPARDGTAVSPITAGTDSSDGISRIVRRSPTLPAREHVLCPNTIGARAVAITFKSGLVGLPAGIARQPAG